MLSLCLFLGSSCSSLYIERNSSFKEGRQIQKIVSLDPSFDRLDTRKDREEIYLNSEVLEAKFNRQLTSNATKAGIELEIIDRDELSFSDVDYFNTILPLKQQIISANFLQEVESSRSGKFSFSIYSLQNTPNSRVFDDPPRFDPAFGKLSDIYETPYFAIQGVIQVIAKPKANWGLLILLLPIGIIDLFVPDNQLVYYSALVNIESGEVLYREIREIDAQVSKSKLNSMIYDSFRIMKHKVK